jgi:hypothetical protein
MQILATVLDDPGTLKKFIESRFDLAWLGSKDDLSQTAVFSETGTDAYRFMLKHYEKHHQAPSRDYFERSFPPETMKVPRPTMTPDEVLDVAVRERKIRQLEVVGSDFIDLFDAGKFDQAEQLIDETARNLRNQGVNPSVHLVLDSDEYDVEDKFGRTETPGIRTGHPTLDDAFPGFQPGQLIVYLGRSKAMKTTHAIKSALAAHEDGWNVLFVSVEITADSIADRFDCHAAGIDHSDYVRGRLSDKQRSKLLEMQERRGLDGKLHIVQPTSAYTLTDLESDIDRYEPDYVVVDGFYFLIDRATGKSGANWEGNDNLSREIAELTLRRGISTLVTMQIREKQARSGKKGSGFDDNSIVGGTGLTMACFYMFTLDFDPDTGINTMTNTRARTGYLPTLRGIWMWKDCSFDPVGEDINDDEEEADY